MEFSKEEILAQLERIISSSTFAKTAINVKLLTFLVHASLNDTEVKEVTIGNEMFGKKYDPIKNDNKVRVYVYHLRKKLKIYYTEEAGKDEILFSIDKGQYRVQFYKQNSTNNKYRKRIYWIGSALSLFAVLTIIYFSFIKREATWFWKDNINKNFPTTVLIGDHYTMMGPLETGGSGIIRDFDINSDAEFNSFIQKNSEKASVVSPNTYTYITKMGAYCSKHITQYFDQQDLNFNLLLSSEWEISNMNDENVVYIGQSKNLRSLKNMLEESFPQLSFNNYNIAITDSETGEKVLYSDTSSDVLVDYSLVAKITGPAGNSLKFFLSEHDGGVINSLKYFTNKDSVEAFYNQHQIGDRDFMALFKVTGWERTGYNIEFVLIDFKE